MKVVKHKETELIIDKIAILKREGLLASKRQAPTTDDNLLRALAVLRDNSFQDILGYFVNHRPSSQYSRIDDEYKVQDLLFCLLRPIFPDLQYEDPIAKNRGAVTSTRIDLVSKVEKLLIEAKYADSKHGARKIESEISEDIIKYGKSGVFTNIFFFVYCANYSFPSAVEFANSFTGLQRVNSVDIQTFCIIKP